MGQRLVEFYKKAGTIGGLKAKMRLAMLTLIPSGEADTAEDNPENIDKFVKAMIEIEKEFGERTV